MNSSCNYFCVFEFAIHTKEKHLTLKKNSQGALSRNSFPVRRLWLQGSEKPPHALEGVTLLVTIYEALTPCQSQRQCM